MSKIVIAFFYGSSRWFTVRLFGWLLFLLLCWSLQATQAQNKKIDYLKASLSRAKSPTEKSNLCHEIAAELWDYDFEAGKQYVDKAYALARKANYTQGIVQALTDYGLYAYFQGNYKLARQYYQKAIAAANGKNFGDFPSYTYTRIGNLFRVQSVYDSARLFYHKALALVDEQKDLLAASSAYYNMGMLDHDEYDYDNAEKNINKSLSIHQLMNDSLLMAESWKGLFSVYKSTGKYEKAKEAIGKAEKIARNYNDPEMLMYCYVYGAELSYLAGDYVITIKTLEKALSVLQTHQFKRYEALTLERIGDTYWSIGSYDRSQEHYIRATKIYKSIGEKRGEARVHASMGWVYQVLYQYQLAEAYGMQSLSLAKEINAIDVLGYANNMLGSLFLLKKDYNKSLVFLNEALRFRNMTKVNADILPTKVNIAWAYQEMGRYQEALHIYQEALTQDEKTGNKENFANDYNGIGRLYTQMKEYDKAAAYLRKSKELSRNISYAELLADNLLFTAKLEAARGNSQNAIKLYEELLTFKDSVANQNSSKKILEINALLEIEAQEAKIENLAQLNEQKQKLIESQKSTVQAQRLLLTYSIVLAGVLLTGAIIFYRQNKQRLKSNQKLQELNKQISSQAEEIQAQSEELLESNKLLSALNGQLRQNQEEIIHQNEELAKGKEEVSAQRDLLSDQNTQLQEAKIEVENHRSILEQEVSQRTQELVEYNRQLEQFAFISSHNLRAPVARIIGLGNLLDLTHESADFDMIKKSMVKSARDLDQVVKDLNLILEIKKTTVQVFSEINLHDVYLHVLDFLEAEIKSTEAEIHADFSEVHLISGVLPYVQSIFLNLISNAIKYRYPNRNIKINLATSQTEKFMQVEVRDNGLGIDLEKYGAKVFRLYSRFHDHVDGKGLGLYMVKAQMEAMGGTVQLFSKVNQGCTFVLQFPKKN
ncbi:MAG: tetratricopeptide repeat protein [Bacteroidetes bacterium]|nr:tetratricopeptide repeat protein [Bacteroidota bacterium]MBS1541575.1 tetratricopeptide repeat protein [Bacteroidota bacterium]